jgi:hypothetical protein
MIVKLILTIPLLTIVFYTIVGIIKREVWIAGRPPAFHAIKEKGSRALIFGVLFSILYIFFLFYFIYEMQLSFSSLDWVIIVVLSVLCTWFVVFSEKKLVNIKNPFKVLIPVLAIIAVVSYISMLYFMLQS